MKTPTIQLSVSLAGVLLLPAPLQAGPGALDTSFDPGTTLGTACCTAAFGVNCIGVQTNGMLVIGGFFEGFIADNAARNFLARLKVDGSLDNSFDAKLGTNGASRGPVSALVLQPDGKIVIAGGFTNID